MSRKFGGSLKGSRRSTQNPMQRSMYNGKSLIQVKQERQQIENDAQALANRIALLKQEELKTWKKIEETKKKAYEIYILKKKNEERQKIKVQALKKRRQFTKNKTYNSSALRKKQYLARRNVLNAVYKHKYNMVQKIKNQKKRILQKKYEQQSQLIENNRQRNKQIRAERMLGSLRVQEYHEKKADYFKQMHQNRIKDEEDIRTRKEQEVLQMEELETELIRKLQHTQQIQKQAYQELESALTLPSHKFVSKFQKKTQQQSVSDLQSENKQQNEEINKNNQSEVKSGEEKQIEKSENGKGNSISQQDDEKSSGYK